MGEKVEYPKYLFKRGAPDVVAQTVESHQLYAAEGYLTAAEYDALPPLSAEPEMAAVVPTPGDEVVPVTGNEVSSDVPQDTPENAAQAFETLSAADAITRARACSDVDALRAWRAAEENRKGGGRATVLRALADRLGESVAPAAPQDDAPVTASE